MEQLLRLLVIAAAAYVVFDKKAGSTRAVQSRMEIFHKRIKLDEDDEKTKLRQKREIILQELKSELAERLPRFEYFHQGSYAMHTGVVPLDADYDIDIGLVFDCSQAEYPDPVTLKIIVRDLLKRGSRKVRVRNSCVTVEYAGSNDASYHVDLAIYVSREDGTLAIAKGKEHSKPEYRCWEMSNPRGLTALLISRFAGQELTQYRRCIRYLKRWRDISFKSGAPSSIALTVAAFHWFKPRHASFSAAPLDLKALLDWVRTTLDQFVNVGSGKSSEYRLRVFLPCEPRVDLLERMTPNNMQAFHLKLVGLRDCLVKGYGENSPERCLEIAACQFGHAFIGE